MLYLFLIHPERGVEGAPKLDFSILRKLGHRYIELVSLHAGPDIGLFFVISGVVAEDEKAGAFDMVKVERALVKSDILGQLFEITMCNPRLSILRRVISCLLNIYLIFLRLFFIQLFLKYFYDKIALTACVSKWRIEFESTVYVSATAVASRDKRIIDLAEPIVIINVLFAQKEVSLLISRFST